MRSEKRRVLKRCFFLTNRNLNTISMNSHVTISSRHVLIDQKSYRVQKTYVVGTFR